MSRTTSVTLGEPLNQFVAQMIESGRYGSASEVMRSALRLLEQQENHIAHIRQLIQEGIDSGVSEQSFDEIIAEARAEYQQHKS